MPKETLSILFLCFCLIAMGLLPLESIAKEKTAWRTSVKLKWISDDQKSLQPGDYKRAILHNGKPRFYHLHVPPNFDSKKTTPIVLVFHGGGGNPRSVRYESRMDEVSNKYGFLVVYPAGTPAGALWKNKILIWNDGRPLKDGTKNKIDDVGFVNELLKDLKNYSKIDQRRTFACGYSNGAQLTYCLAKKLSDKIAAIAAVAGQRRANEIYPPPERPISVLQFAGKLDLIGPYYGGKAPVKAPFKTNLAPIPEAINSWVKFNQCPSKPNSMVKIGNTMLTKYGPGLDNTEVILWTIINGGHTWPGGRVHPLLRKKLGPINQEINASEEMWKFFSKHQLSKSFLQ